MQGCSLEVKIRDRFDQSTFQISSDLILGSWGATRIEGRLDEKQYVMLPLGYVTPLGQNSR